jgi:hypothetical protein
VPVKLEVVGSVGIGCAGYFLGPVGLELLLEERQALCAIRIIKTSIKKRQKTKMTKTTLVVT